MEFKKYVSVMALMAISGCTVNPVPKGWDGELAVIYDSTDVFGGHFVVSRINGARISNTIGASMARSHGLGMGAYVYVPAVSRDVPVMPLVITIEGEIQYGSELERLASPNRRLIKTLFFTPSPGMSYTVRGEVLGDQAVVFLEDALGNRVTSEGCVEGKHQNSEFFCEEPAPPWRVRPIQGFVWDKLNVQWQSGNDRVLLLTTGERIPQSKLSVSLDDVAIGQEFIKVANSKACWLDAVFIDECFAESN